jgi:hypothetical protein
MTTTPEAKYPPRRTHSQMPAAKKLTPAARANPTHRAARHRFHLQMLTHHQQAQQIVAHWRL